MHGTPVGASTWRVTVHGRPPAGSGDGSGRTAGARRRLRELAQAESGTPSGPGTNPGGVPRRLDARTTALTRLAALVALRAAPDAYRRAGREALDAGATVDDVLGTLTAVAGTVGLARVVSAAPGLALAVGYDLDAALEGPDDAVVRPRR